MAAATLSGYDYTKDGLAQLLIARFYPERTDRESGVIRDFLIAHGAEFDKFSFSVRVGTGATPDPNAPVNIQKQQVFVTQKRIDLLAWRGRQPVIVEVKYLVTPASLGQILSYRIFFLEAVPDAPEPELVVIGRYSDPDTIRSLNAHNVTVYLYPDANASSPAAGGGV